MNFAVWRFGGEPGTSRDPDADLIETQCHGLDMLEHLCGPIDSVMAQMTSREGLGHPTVAVSVGFASGAVGTLLGSYETSYAYPGTHFLEVNGTDGRLLIEDSVKRSRSAAPDRRRGRSWEAGYFDDDGRDFHHTFDHYADALLAALKAGAPPPVHARAGRRALELARAIIASYESGVRVAGTR